MCVTYYVYLVQCATLHGILHCLELFMIFFGYVQLCARTQLACSRIVEELEFLK